MIGRERELEAGGRLIAALAGGSRSLVLEGEPGIGKTTIWRELVRRSRSEGIRVVASRPAETEAKLPFVGLSDVLSDVSDDELELLPGPQRRALDVALLRAAPGPHPPEQRAICAGLCSALFGLAASTPVLVAVDDLQWLDRPSQAALEFAVRRAGTRRIGFLFSVRHAVAPMPLAGLERALSEFETERVAVGPLSVAALHQLIRERLDHAFARPTIVKIGTAARGNPFHALEIAQELLRRGATSARDTLPAPEDLSQLAARRIRRLPVATRRQLLAAAALSSPTLGVLDAADLEPAIAAELIELHGTAVAFTHPLFAAAVYATASEPARRRLHRRLADLVSTPEERARHLALGADGPSEAIAAELDAAAGQAMSRGAPDAAAELFELAAELTPAGAASTAIARLSEAANCHLHSGDLARAHALAERVRVGDGPPEVRARALRVLGEMRYMEGSFGDALTLFDEALELVADGAEAAELRLDLAFAHSILGHAQAAAEHARAAVEAATASGDAGLQAAALAMSATREFRLGQPLDRARLDAALALEDPDRHLILPLRPSRLAGIAEYYSDNFGRAAELYSGLRRRMIDRGEDSHLPMLDSDLAMAERTRGNLRRALEIADEGCEIAQVVASHTVQADMLCERSYVRAALGDVDGARADADATRACTTDDWYADTWLTGLHGFLELSLGDAAAAGRALEPLAGVVEAAGECDQFTATIIPDEIEALIALGQLDRARVLLGILREYAVAQERHSTLGRVERCAALLAAADGELAEAEQLVAIAIEHHERVEIPLELGRTLLAAAQIRRRAKRKGAARDSCRAASEIFETLGARLWLERAASELRRTGMRHAEGDELTPTETRVAELAATGLTNRRIAEALFVSPKTVEANLARIYLKLGIRTRAELGRVMAQSDTTRTSRH